MAKRGEARRAEMRELLAAQESSGLSVARFAHEHGISSWTMYKWRRRLREESEEGKPPFVEVRVVEEGGPARAMAVELESGIRVHVPGGFDESELRRLLGVLSSC